MAGTKNGTAAAAKNGDDKAVEKESGKTPVKNGKSPTTKKDTNKETSFSSKIFLIPALVALFSLVAGVLTPPLLTYHNWSHPPGGSNSIQRWMASMMGPKFPNCDVEALSHFLHDNPVEGLHVVCIAQRDNNSLELKLFKGASYPEDVPMQVKMDAPSPSSPVSWRRLQRILRSALDLHSQDDLHQPWAIFCPVGERLVEEDEALNDVKESNIIVKKLLDSGMVLIFEGGQWQWPGVRVGYKRSVDLYSIMPGDAPESATNKTRTVVLETINLQPLVLSVEGFLSPFECDHVLEVATPEMKYSPVVLMDGDEGKDASQWRTSQSAFVPGQDEVFLDLEYRTASLVRIPKNHQEDLQVLKYGLQQFYSEHHDFFDPALYSQDESTLELIQYGRRNRMATVFWYLSDVAEGGETAFPKAAGMETDNFCEEGLRVKPQRGKVIIFYSLLASGEMDDRSLHAACPIKEGIKWAANKWVWSAAFEEEEDDDGYDDEDEYDEEYYAQGEYVDAEEWEGEDEDGYWEGEDDEEAWEEEHDTAEEQVDVKDA